MRIDKILKEYEKKHEGILESKKRDRNKNISGRWDIKRLLKIKRGKR